MERGSLPHARFAGLSFDAFRDLAQDTSLSENERIGFPDEYREGTESAILADIRAKLPAIDARDRLVVDIGPGCARLPRMLRDVCVEHGHRLVFIDSREMLDHHPDGPDLCKVPARFPCAAELIDDLAGTADAVIVYSVLQYALVDASPIDFVDAALELLAPGGRLLIGDLPNASMRKRFLVSEAGLAHHRRYVGGGDSMPAVTFNRLERGELDDALSLAIVARARAAGFHAWIVPQAAGLPMANRREDILVERP
jgi:hypothetical protein